MFYLTTGRESEVVEEYLREALRSQPRTPSAVRMLVSVCGRRGVTYEGAWWTRHVSFSMTGSIWAFSGFSLQFLSIKWRGVLKFIFIEKPASLHTSKHISTQHYMFLCEEAWRGRDLPVYLGGYVCVEGLVEGVRYARNVIFFLFTKKYYTLL